MNPLRAALLPLAAGFGTVALVRARLYRHGLLPRERLAGPVISVGNLGVGGRGKTPVVALVAEMVRAANLPVAVLSRGYRGTYEADALLVSDGKRLLADAGHAGDEPVMLGRALPGVRVAVGRRRVEAGRLVEGRYGPCVHVLDDGFQHLGLARDLDVLCLGPQDLADWPMPAGALREFPSAHSRAHVLLVERTGAGEAWARRDPGRVFVASRAVTGFSDLDGRDQRAPRVVVAVAGIARPERFLADLRSRVEVAEALLFPDHHRYTPADLARIAERARGHRVDAVVTTAKDAVRLGPLPEAPPLQVLRIRAVIDDEPAFKDRVLAVARRLS